ncbi:MAG: tyrosine-type recombinase/integrase [Rhizomicrobium sp.]
MVSIEMKGLHRVRSKGRTYYYAWRGGPRLEGEPGTPEFLQSYQDAKAPQRSLDKRKLSTWITLYKASPEFRELSERTKKEWLPWLDRIINQFGSLSIRQFDRPQIRLRIRAWRDKWRKTPRTADFAKQVLSRVLSYAAESGALTTNPCRAIGNLYSADRSEIIWTPADIDHFCKANKDKPEIVQALKLACLTGLRQGDLLRLSWGHVGAHAIEIATGKGRRHRRKAVAPLTAEIRALLAEMRKARTATAILTNSRGQPWRGFNSSWTKARANAWPGGKELHFHDARGTAATNYFRAGFTMREIAEIMGWSENRVERLIDTYVKRDEILADRVRRLEHASAASEQSGTAEEQKL